ncbi:ribonuclease P protein component [uncultured Jatrophihabitans sp.]|uniref:ribonuclease P protein component n=1 Tax=uncultured Jatrophihabitans sp. TaxID=1610747 RepID=UPI0035CB800C
MLPSANRLRRSSDFSSAVRSGARVRNGRVVVHQTVRVTDAGDDAAPRVGLIVGRSVGPSVVRHRVSRRLRAQFAMRLDRLPEQSNTVVRALPSAARATSVELGRDLERALTTLAGRR